MTGLLILTFIPAAAAVLFWLRVREQRRRIAELTQQLASSDMGGKQAHERRIAMLGTVAHELRSPIAAILGYEELMSEGVFGPLDGRSTEALARIRSSARQLLTLTDGMQELAQDSEQADTTFEPVDFAAALADALVRADGEAEARRVQLVPVAANSPVHGYSERRILDGVLDAACGAALKTSAERTLRVRIASDDETVRYRIEGTGMEPGRLEQEPFASGAGLRIAIARRLASRLAGTVAMVPAEDGTTTLEITLPRNASAMLARSD